MTPQELRNSILQLAVQGKLVEQRPDEGTAEELYRQIQAEKQKLIEEGKIKKGKPLLEITEDEIPFDIPETWKWVRMNSVITLLSGADLSPTQYNDKGEGIPYITGASNIIDNRIIINRWTTNQKNIAHAGDLLLTCKGTVGKTAILEASEVHIARQIMAITTICINTEYVKFFVESSISELKSKAKSMIPGIERNNVLSLAFPLPPLAEQKRIVAKIEELLPLIDRYEQAWTKLEAFNKRFPSDMQKSVLQMAIKGKLVEQRPEEGTGEELYKQIQTEKQKLIAEGKIKKDKRTGGLDAPSVDESRFDIPDSWKWAYLGSILNKLTDGTHRTPKYATSGVKFVSVKDMSNGILSLDNTKFITEAEHIELFSRCDPQRGDMLLSKVGTTGVPAIIDTDEPFSLFVSVALLKYSHNCIDERFLYYLLKSPLVQEQATENTRGVGNKNWVLDAIAKTVVVLPPLAEQKRIVQKLDEILPLCDKLK